MASIEAEWTRLCELERPSVVRSKPNDSEAEAFLRDAILDFVHHGLADRMVAYVRTKPADYFLSGFGRSLSDCLILALRNACQREALVSALAAHCPERIGFHYPTELAIANAPCQWEAPVAVLFDAFDQSTNVKSRETIVALLHRGFPMIPREHGDGGIFVEACRTWYTLNQKNVTVNAEYSHIVIAPMFYEDTPLFVFRRE